MLLDTWLDDFQRGLRADRSVSRGSLHTRVLLTDERRILNVSVIPYDTHSPTKLLNVHTAPDCVIFTAIIASAAVPGILNPVVLM